MNGHRRRDEAVAEAYQHDHAAQVAVAFAIRHQHMKPRRRCTCRGQPQARIVERGFRTDDRFDTRARYGLVKARRALKSVAIAERDRVVAKRSDTVGQLFGRARTFEKAERAARP
jgi:hypothetical protein